MVRISVQIGKVRANLKNGRLDEFFSLDNENLIKEINSWDFKAMPGYILHSNTRRADISIHSDNDDLAEQKLRKFYETEKVNWGFTKCTIDFSRC